MDRDFDKRILDKKDKSLSRTTHSSSENKTLFHDGRSPCHQSVTGLPDPQGKRLLVSMFDPLCRRGAGAWP